MARNQGILAVVMLQLVLIHAYVSFLPPIDDTDDMSDNSDDMPAESLEEKLYNKLLSNILLENFYKAQQRQYADLTRDAADIFQTSKRYIPDRSIRKRGKVFWQPLGYIPGGVNRINNQNNQAASSSSQKNSKMFRYG